MRSDRRLVGWRAQFVLLSVIWGSSFLFIKVLDRHWPPLWVAFGRVAIGAITLLVLVGLRRERMVRDPRLWGHCAIAALMFNAVPFTLFAFGERHTSSILAGMFNATTPLWTLIVALIAFPEQRPTAGAVLGLLLGFLGVLILLGFWRGLGSGALVGDLACAGAAACYGLGFPYTRRHLAGSHYGGAALSACQLTCAALMMALALPFSAGASVDLGWQGAGSLLALGCLGSGVAYAINYAIVRARGSSAASTVTYLIPVFSTLLGVSVLSERLYWNEPLGGVVLLIGVALSQGRIAAALIRRPRARRSAPEAPS